jgi:hypothetical protein
MVGRLATRAAPSVVAAFSPRPACSDAERRLAVWAHDDLRLRGHEAWVETHWIRPQLAAGLALGCALTAVGGLIAIGAPPAGLVAAAVGAVSVAVDAAGWAGPLRWLLPRCATQVVLAAAEDAPAGEARVDAPPVELFLAARTDVPRGGLGRRLATVPGGLWWLPACALAIVAAAAARVAGADGTLLGALQLVPTVVLLAAVAGALDQFASPVGDGRAEDAAIAAAIAAHERLVREPPPGIAAGLLLAGPDGLRAHLRREGLDPRRTALLHVADGPVRSRHPQWRAAARAAGLIARRTGPRGLPAAVAPPADAERLARGLAATLQDRAGATKWSPRPARTARARRSGRARRGWRASRGSPRAPDPPP